MQEKNANNKKSRYWTFVIYPESLPNNWKDILISSHLKIAVSPLHDKDLNPTGEIKKAHYHVLVVFDGPTTFNRVNEISESIKGTICQIVSNVGGLYRYFTHKDNPEKAQYSETDILALNGFNYLDYDGMSISEEVKVFYNVQTFIQENEIEEYSILLDCLKSKYESGEMFREYYYSINHSFTINSYLKSRYFNNHKV